MSVDWQKPGGMETDRERLLRASPIFDFDLQFVPSKEHQTRNILYLLTF